jgi:EAL domain-containing protein (putative c-di-GMP-specific phosphodiesterase class I)
MDHRPANILDAIVVDEVGIAIGRYLHFHLKSAYQQVFRREGKSLRPVAVEGLIAPFVEGKPAGPLRLFEQVLPGDEIYIEGMCRALHLCNYRNIGVPGLELFFNFDPHVNGNLDASIGQIRFLVHVLDEIGLDARLLVCELTEAAALSEQSLLRIVEEIRRHGIRVAIDGFGSGHSTLERVDLIQPDIVKLDGRWFRQIAHVPGTVRLLPSLIEGFKARGAQLLVEGVETPYQLKAALEAGADFVQGFFLARPLLAGTPFEETLIEVESLVGDERKVVRLFR